MELQRTPPPFDRRTPRRRDGSGGPVVPLTRRTLVNGIENSDARYSPTTNDSQILRDKTPWYPAEVYYPAGQSWVNWTAAGPVRPELHMRDVTIRTMVGTSATRNLQNPVIAQHEVVPGYRSLPDGRIVQPTVGIPSGLHTNPAAAVQRSFPRYVKTPQIVPGRQDRLRAGQYTGQSYSQTTIPQGG